MAAGSIIIDLLMRTGSFSTDSDRAAKALRKLQKEAQEVGRVIGTVVSAAVVGTAVAFDQLVKAAGNFKDIEEMTGASAEALASFQTVADIAGVSVDGIGSAMLKLTKNLSGVDDESKAAGAALKALGIPIEEFKRLAPEQQMDALAKAFGEFADGPQKGAAAMALFGKTGAELLKVFKALEEEGGRQVLITQAQIEAADAYADAQAKAMSRLKQFAQVASIDALPAVNDLINAAGQLVQELTGVDSAGKQLTTESPVAAFAEAAVDSLAFVVDAADGVVRAFKITGSLLGALGAQAAAVLRGDFKAALQIDKDAAAEIDRILNKKLFSTRIEEMRAARKEAEALARIAAMGPPAPGAPGAKAKPKLGFDGPTKTDRTAADKVTEAERYLEALDRQVQGTLDLTRVEEVLADIQKGRLKDATDQQKMLAVALAGDIDNRRAQIKIAKETEEANKKAADAIKDQKAEAERLAQSVETPIERLNRKLAELNKLQAENPFVSRETILRAEIEAQKEYADAVEATNTKLDTFADRFNENMQDFMGDAFYKALDGNFKDIGDSFVDMLKRMAAEAAAADLARLMFGDKNGQQGSSGSWIGTLIGAVGSMFGASAGGGGGSGGDAAAGAAILGSLSTGTDRIPKTGLYRLHEGEKVVPKKYNPAANGITGGSIEVVNPPGMPLNVNAKEEPGPDGRMIKRLVLSVLTDDVRTGGPASQAMSAAYGLKRQLPRRGT